MFLAQNKTKLVENKTLGMICKFRLGISVHGKTHPHTHPKLTLNSRN
jgi:hypothetical protein